jgi:FtsH-binding integral membrane protein
MGGGLPFNVGVDELSNDLREYRDAFFAGTRRLVAVMYAVTGIALVVCVVGFAVSFADASSSERRTALVLLAGVSLVLGVIQWWWFDHPSSPEQSRALTYVATGIGAVGVFVLRPVLDDQPALYGWTLGVFVCCSLLLTVALARRRLWRDPVALARARDQGWSTDPGEHVRGFFRRGR